MNLKFLSTLFAVVGVAITVFSGSAIARRTGMDTQTWLMTVFALGILLLSQGPVIRLRQQVLDLQQRLAERASDA